MDAEGNKILDDNGQLIKILNTDNTPKIINIERHYLPVKKLDANKNYIIKLDEEGNQLLLEDDENRNSQRERDPGYQAPRAAHRCAFGGGLQGDPARPGPRWKEATGSYRLLESQSAQSTGFVLQEWPGGGAAPAQSSHTGNRQFLLRRKPDLR